MGAYVRLRARQLRVAGLSPDGSLRPIAIGESIRRLTSTVAVDLISECDRSIFEPVQVGVKTSNGCEATLHVTRQWFNHHRADQSRAALSVDTNAFNSVHRTAIFQAGCARSFLLWVDRHDSTLFSGASNVASQVISSTRGVKQGAPWARSLRPRLDDGLCVGTAPAVRCSLSSLRLGLRQIGLEVSQLRQDRSHPPRAVGMAPSVSSFQAPRSALCRVAKARTLLHASGRVPDAQEASSLVHALSGQKFSTHAARFRPTCNPPPSTLLTWPRSAPPPAV